MKAIYSGLLLAVLGFTTLAGCLTGLTAEARETHLEITPEFVTESVDWWEKISRDYPKHDSNLPANAELRGFLESELRAIGFDVETRVYPGSMMGVPTPGLEIHAIVATKLGTTNPDHAIGLVSHYDSQAATIYAAYDDKSGVAAEFHICRALAEVPLDRTLACIFFDAEERGLAASQAYVADAITNGNSPFEFDVVFGYDMTGINWPGHAWKMYLMQSEAHAPFLSPISHEVMYDRLGYPTDGVEILDVHDRNSDEQRFKAAGIPVYRFAGGRTASDYPMYHLPGDTVEYVYFYTGSRANFEAGFTTILQGSVDLILAIDNLSIAETASWKS